MTKPQPHALQKILDRIPEEWGVYASIGEGWHKLVLDLDGDLADIDPDYVIHQVKEKFAGLRYYAEMSPESREKATDDQRVQFVNLIDKAEAKSYTICETCGEPGRERKSGFWVYTSCEKHIDTEGAG